MATGTGTGKKRAPVDKKATLAKLAGKRVPNALKTIARIGNLANYDPTPEQANRILTALRTALQDVESRLKSPGKKSEVAFTL